MIIKIASISDIHIGHQRVTPEVIHDNLKKVLYPQLTNDLQLLVVGGDFFDTLLDMNGQSGYHAALIIDELLNLAVVNQFFIRVVRGTFSHDRLQNQFFTKMVDPLYHGDELVVRVFDTITIEHLKALQIHILYVPDDLPYEDAMPVIKDKVMDAQLGKVDIAVVHSYFEHLLPAGIPRIPANTYNADVFGELVNGVILNGHIHKPCAYKKVLTNGSFERLAHGEEETKGFFMVEYDTESNKASHKFIENPYATNFSTIDLCNYLTEEDGLARLIPWLTELIEADQSTSDRLFVRVIASDAIMRQAAVLHTRANYPDIVVSSRQSSQSNEATEEVITQITSLPIITEDNLPDMVAEFLRKEKDVEMSADYIHEVLCNA